MMDKYELIAIDVDGTLLDSRLELTPGNRDAIHRAAKAGKQIVISTGRCLAEIRHLLKELPEIRYLVCENGSCVYDCAREEIIHVDAIPADEVVRVLDAAQRGDAIIQVFSENKSYIVSEDDAWLEAGGVTNYRELFRQCSRFDARLFDDFEREPFQVEKINLYMDGDDARRQMKERLADHPLDMADSIGYMIELVSNMANKGRGLKMLCRYLGLSMERAIAVGDSMNDVSMLKAAGFGVAMGNACEGAKAAADFITNDCDHDGVARVIDEYLMA